MEDAPTSPSPPVRSPERRLSQKILGLKGILTPSSSTKDPLSPETTCLQGRCGGNSWEGGRTTWPFPDPLPPVGDVPFKPTLCEELVEGVSEEAHPVKVGILVELFVHDAHLPGEGGS